MLRADHRNPGAARRCQTKRIENMRKNQHYGWIPDIPDQRDLKFSPALEWKLPESMILKALPSVTDLSSGCGPVLDQGQLGSCTANATSGAITFIDPGFL